MKKKKDAKRWSRELQKAEKKYKGWHLRWTYEAKAKHYPVLGHNVAYPAAISFLL